MFTDHEPSQPVPCRAEALSQPCEMLAERRAKASLPGVGRVCCGQRDLGIMRPQPHTCRCHLPWAEVGQGLNNLEEAFLRKGVP